MTGNLVSFDTVRRLLDTRRRVAAQLYAARIPVIAEQLRAMRGTYPRGWAS